MQKLFSRLIPKKFLQKERASTWKTLSLSQKKDLAERYMTLGEEALEKGDLKALFWFQSATELDPQNFEHWYRQALAFLQYGKIEGNEKFVTLASKHVKYSLQLSPHHLPSWHLWGKALFELGEIYEEHHFYLQAQEKFAAALSLSAPPSPALLWDLGKNYLSLASYSEEPHDICLALSHLFAASTHLQKEPLLCHDIALGLFEKGLSLASIPSLFEALSWAQKGVHLDPSQEKIWDLLGQIGEELYTKTGNRSHFSLAKHALERALHLSPSSSDICLSLAHLLSQGGIGENHPPYERESIELCKKAAALDKENPLAFAQWGESLAHLATLTHRIEFVEEANQILQKGEELFPSDPDIAYAYSLCHFVAAQYFEDLDCCDLAIAKIQEALSSDRCSTHYWHLLGKIYLYYAKLLPHPDYLERAKKFLEKSLLLSPDTANILLDLALCQTQLSEFSSSIELLEQGIGTYSHLFSLTKASVATHPTWFFAYASALEWLFELSNEFAPLQEALQLLLQISLLHPEFPDILEKIARVYHLQARETGDIALYQKALSFYHVATQQKEDTDTLWLDWGICLLHLSEEAHSASFQEAIYQEAEKKLLQAGMLGNLQSHYYLSCLFSLKKDFVTSLHFFTQALEKKSLPSWPDILEEDWLENLRETSLFQEFLHKIESKLASMDLPDTP